MVAYEMLQSNGAKKNFNSDLEEGLRRRSKNAKANFCLTFASSFSIAYFSTETRVS
jgi:hypothetical protein